ncbi:hypothetical protein KP509_22G000600 [Ceratopteris richardii]|uniref:Uncharacterized protein n=1 Tax=Ceratopteris richardii TaxID=49495 RepID=A0A8T2S2V2_CERRI|nr:hypothetical protein KP509_22G000600 [Ceratopteris richardii]KAH7306179.1 hypothetical protein KP509_22G000600 [Ceratopteris richardii]
MRGFLKKLSLAQNDDTKSSTHPLHACGAVEASCSKTAPLNESPLPEFIIAMDFGTTFSGFAYTRTGDATPEIRDNCRWPFANNAGAAAYCKNQTSLYYVPKVTQDGQFHLELKEWGWGAFVAYHNAFTDFQPSTNLPHTSTSFTNTLDYSERLLRKVGFFAYKFKLYLSPTEADWLSLPPLPWNLKPQILIVDYLRKLTELIMDTMKAGIRGDFSLRDVQWCLTVPAIWEEEAKQLMRTYAEMAGMITGNLCPNNCKASPYPLKIILEPEAASVYCQNEAGQNLKTAPGDRILVADLGGGTLDIVVHQILEVNDKGIAKVKEAIPSYGEIGGGTFVDDRFFDHLKRRIPCFEEYRSKVPSIGLDFYNWWKKVMPDFDGDGYEATFNLVGNELAKDWKEYDMHRGSVRHSNEYSRLHFSAVDFRAIFEPDVEKVISLIEKGIKDVKILMVVGGFSASPYLRKRIRQTFGGRVAEIITPMDPGRAICRGAVELHRRSGYIQARVSRRTYGICCTRDYKVGDPHELLERDDDQKLKCRRVFTVFVRKGTEVVVGKKEKRSYFPVYHGQRAIQFDLYSSPRENPCYTTEEDAKKEGSFVIDISKGKSKDKKREIEVTMLFGDSIINVTAARKNFGSRKDEECYEVRFDRC